MNALLSSSSNPKIKYLVSLDKARERRRFNQFVIEGQKEIIMAEKSGYTFEMLFYCPEIISEEVVQEMGISVKEIYPIAKSVFEKIAYRESTGGVIAIANQKEIQLDNIILSSNPLVLIVESIEKPGNLGALLRTADAAGLDAVISCDPRTDFYNPNTVRSSLGCVFSNQIATANSEQTIHWLKSNGIKIYCTHLDASMPYTQIDFTSPSAIVMGSEANGLSSIWVRNSDNNIIIPMNGKVDSMNVSVSAAIVMFEALRQRGN